jgi:hypothetical protein
MTATKLLNVLKKGKKLTKSVVDSTPQSVITHFHKRLAMYDRGDKRLSVEKLINDIKKFSANQRGGEGGKFECHITTDKKIDCDVVESTTYLIVNAQAQPIGQGGYGAVYLITSTLIGERMTLSIR